jgi:hypothetical protein
MAKWSRRHKSAVATVVLILLLAVLGLSISNLLIAREKAKVQAAYQDVARQQKTTAAALQEEARQRAIAEQNFQQAREMLDTLVQVSVDGMLQDAAAENVHSDLLHASLRYYENFIRQASNDPPVQAQLASAYLRVAKILDAVGSTPASRAALQKALEIQEQLVRANPQDRELRRELFAMYYDQGALRGRLQPLLIGRDAVQRHLTLSGEQVVAIHEILERQRHSNREFMDSHGTEPTEWRKVFQQNADAAHEAIAAILEPAQLARLEQIVLQRRGSRAFADADVAAVLGLSAEQKLRISMLREEASPFRQANPWVPPKRGESLDERVMAVLTDPQRAKWQEMIGEPFHDDWREWRAKRPPAGWGGGPKK